MPKPSPHRRKAAEYRERDLAILRHVFRYGVGLNALVSPVLFGGKEAGHVLRQFGDKNWLVMHSAAIPGGISYGTLTANGGKEIGRQLKPKPLGAVALDSAISVGYYCAIASRSERRYRLLAEEIKQIGRGLSPNVPHVVTEEFGKPVVLRVQSVASGKLATIKQKASDYLDKASLNKRTAPWVRTGQLSMVLLGHTSERVKQVEKAVAADKAFSRFRIRVALGPTAETLAKCLRARRKEK